MPPRRRLLQVDPQPADGSPPAPRPLRVGRRRRPASSLSRAEHIPVPLEDPANGETTAARPATSSTSTTPARDLATTTSPATPSDKKKESETAVRAVAATTYRPAHRPAPPPNHSSAPSQRPGPRRKIPKTPPRSSLVSAVTETPTRGHGRLRSRTVVVTRRGDGQAGQAVPTVTGTSPRPDLQTRGPSGHAQGPAPQPSDRPAPPAPPLGE